MKSEKLFAMIGVMEKQNNFNEVKYLADVARTRSEIANLMKKHNMITKETLDNMSTEVNPYLGRIEKTGAIGLEFTYGHPYALYTPYGKVKIGSAALTEDFGDNAEQEALYHELERKYGMVEVEPLIKKEGVGEFGPWCALTRLPWDKTAELPATFKKMPEKNNSTRFEGLEEVRRVNALLEQADKTIAKLKVVSKKSKCVIGDEKVKTDDVEMGL